MKIALVCQSVLLEKSLKIFLKNYITSYKQCDFVICDRKIKIDKPCFYILPEDSHLVTPFSKSTLLLKVENFYNALSDKKSEKNQKKISSKELEKKIIELTDNFKNNLITTIKDYYDN
ncbi:MAG: hypothetical protein JJV95_05500 [Sulfurospirillum sp.]|nr:hypothetical protein [Sulfurospirillum sp.]MBL0703421.1 hypothetical protein [Sulfurospirillum sp.]